MNPETLQSLIAKRDAIEGALNGLEIWLIVFGILVAIGVGGESVYGIRTWWNNRKLHATEQAIDQLRQAEIARLTASTAISEQKVAEAQRESAEANAKAEAFRLDIAKANEAAKQADARAAEAMLALAQFRAPRALTLIQKQEIATKLKAFSGQKLRITAYTGDNEIVGITNDLTASLTEANWSISLFVGTENGRAVGGMLVEVKKTASGDDLRAANALVEVLKGMALKIDGPAPINEQITVLGSGNTDPTAQVNLVIGKKPQQ